MTYLESSFHDEQHRWNCTFSVLCWISCNSPRPFHSECCQQVGPLVNSFRIYKFLNLFCNSLHVLLVLVSFVVRDAVDSKINRVFKFHLRPNATLMELSWSPISAISFRFPEAGAERWSSYEPIFSECYFWSSRRESSGAHFSLSTFADNLYDALFWRRLVRNNGVRTCLPKFQTSILCWAQVDPIHCILFRSPMNLIMQSSCFVEICD